MAATFQSRRLRLTFKLAAGTFNREAEADTVVFDNFRTSLDIEAPGGYQFATLRARVFGISQETMNRLTVINYQNRDYLRNTITVEATDDEGVYVVVFVGDIFTAQPDYTGAPDVPFVVEAMSGFIGSLTPAQSKSFRGAVPVSTMAEQIAKDLNLGLENNGVESTLTDMYLAGSPIQQLVQLASASGIQYWYVPEQNTLAIAPPGYYRYKWQGDALYIDAARGLVGWPTKLHEGVQFTMIYRPQIFHGIPIHLESAVPACNGDWYIIRMYHKLDGNVPGGAWFSTVVATPSALTIRR